MTFDAGGRQTRRSHALPCPSGDHGCGQHLLLAGGQDDLPVLRHLAATAPACAYGQIFVELDASWADDAEIAGAFEVPGGMGVTVLRRDLSAPAELRHRHGELLARAVAAWASEWFAEDQCSCSGPYALWIGFTTSPDVEMLCHEVSAVCGDVPAHLHRPGQR